MGRDPNDGTVVIEGNPDGHRLYYVRVLAEATSQGELTWLTTPEAYESPQARTHLAGVIDSGRLRVRIVPSCAPSHELLSLLRGRDVVIPDADGWVVPIAIAGRGLAPRRLTLLLMRIPEQMRRDHSVRWKSAKSGTKTALCRLINARSRMASSDVRLMGLGEPFGYVVPQSSWFTAIRDPILPRVRPTREDARRRFALPGTAKIVGLLGRVDLRKNPELVAEAVARLAGDTHLLVAGSMSLEAARVLARVSARTGRVTIVDRYLTEVDIVSAAAACDVVSVLHNNHQSPSGVLALASQMGVGVLVPACGLLDRVSSVGGFGVATALSQGAVTHHLGLALQQAQELGVAAAEAAVRLGAEDFRQKLLRSVDDPH